MRLVIAEKNQAAEQIARALGPTRRERYRDHPIYDVEGGRTVVVPLRGHIVGLDYPAQYNRWRSTPLKVLPTAPMEKQVKERTIAEALRHFAKTATEIVVATDFDQEGELIGLEAVEIVQTVNRAAPILRARMSALAPQDVRKAFANLTGLDYHLAAAGETRQVVDLAWGAVLTRFMTLASGRTGKDYLSVGRVQTPTLALIVDREREIEAFKPQPYWDVTAEVKTASGDRFTLQHEGNRFEEEAKAAAAHERAAQAKEACVAKVERTPRTRRPPTPFNTTSFLQACGRVGIRPPEAAHIAETLYTQGFISYPRTDNEVYPFSTPFDGILAQVERVPGYGEKVRMLRTERRPYPTRGRKETTDHPPIHPVAAPTRALTEREQKVYQVIVDRFLATLAPDARLEMTRVSVPVNGEPFKATGARILEPGWMKYEDPARFKKARKAKKDGESTPEADLEDDAAVLPALAEGDLLKVLGVDNTRKETEPPRRYSQTGLMKVMDDLGLGTKSTRPSILKQLGDRGYITGDPVRPTPIAYAVIDTLRKGAPEITTPEMTSTLEREMEAVAAAKATKADATGKSAGQLLVVIDKLEAERGGVRGAIQQAVVAGDAQKEPLFACPACGKGVVARESREGKRFAGCTGFPACKRTWPLLQKGRLYPSKDPCAKCRGPAVLVYLKGKARACLDLNCRHQEPLAAAAPKRARGGSPRRRGGSDAAEA
ncbi:MAG TPA: DNA topoisomerase I [Candidatus Thermoplasmatota archaeon]|nr:DNA topoisomerase I [Candidatus Thermoplasmatota archaeon]